MLGLQYANQGMKVLTNLACANLFKDYYKLEPGYVQLLTTFVFMPWSFKILYGITSDNFPLCGSRRKSYIVVGSFM